MKHPSTYRVCLLAALLVVLTAGCHRGHEWDCFKSTGDDVTKVRPLEPYTDLDIDDNIDVLLVQDGRNFLEVTAGENIHEGVVTKVENGKLKIYNRNQCNFMRSFKRIPKVVVPVENGLKSIRFSGSQTLWSEDTLRLETLNLNLWNADGSVDLLVESEQVFARIHTGPGDVVLRGRAANCFLFASSDGVIDTRNIMVPDVIVSSSGTGDCYLLAGSSLNVEILSLGDVYYLGQPAITSRLEGKGRLIPLN